MHYKCIYVIVWVGEAGSALIKKHLLPQNWRWSDAPEETGYFVEFLRL